MCVKCNKNKQALMQEVQPPPLEDGTLPPPVYVGCDDITTTDFKIYKRCYDAIAKYSHYGILGLDPRTVLHEIDLLEKALIDKYENSESCLYIDNIGRWNKVNYEYRTKIGPVK